MDSLNATRGVSDCINRNIMSRIKEKKLGLTSFIGGNSELLPFTETEHLEYGEKTAIKMERVLKSCHIPAFNPSVCGPVKAT